MTGEPSSSPEARLARAGVELPNPSAGVVAFAPYRRTNPTMHVSRQLATWGGDLVTAGQLSTEVGVAAGREASKVCALNVLAQSRAAAGGSLEQVAELPRITVSIATAPDFTAQPQVADGASGLLAEVRGPHARAAVGVAVLPMNSPVEVDAIAESRNPTWAASQADGSGR